ncbi:unnamed protein product [Urochloa decumbens]|uniref:F-box domain-containing protein n=1 Tax=Urochloa decumbens TaxID=240449 RepID=A0ABC9BDE5_9POAL
MATPPPPTDDEVDVDEGLSLPTDAFVEVLLRLPTICRLWARHVCRHWRDVIDARTPRIPPPKVLAFFSNDKTASVYVVDDLEHGWGREVWRISAKERRIRHVAAVGTCNGLLCLCDEDKPGGAIASRRSPSRTAGCTLLRVPCHGNMTGGFSVLQALTLGDAAWRDVDVAPHDSCRFSTGVVSVGGAAYWVTEGVEERVVSFDLRDERVALWGLGLAVTAYRTPADKTELWVLGDGAGGGAQGWSNRYSVRVEGARLAEPHFAHGGEYVLTVQSEGWEKSHLHAHRMRDAGRKLLSSEVRSVRIEEPGTALASFKEPGCLRTFAYVETTEPLSAYKVDRRIKGGSIRK